MYSYLSFISPSHTQGSAFQCLELSCSMMSWILCDHLKPEIFNPYSALSITSICPCSYSDSGPATMYGFSFVVALRYAFPKSAPQTFMLFNLGTLLKLLQSRCCLLDQELDDHLLLVLLYGVHHVCMPKPDVH